MHPNDISTQPESIRRLLQGSRTIAVVGLSAKAWRPSNEVARYLRAAGYTVIPVNPSYEEVMGEKCYPSLHEVPVKVDIVDIFRRPEDVMAVIDDAITVGAGSVWLQFGVGTPDAEAKAVAAGLTVVSERCTKIEHARLIGR